DRIAEGVRHLRQPALMLWGPRDPIFSDKYLDDLAERMPHADVHRFEGAGHLLAEDVDYASAALAWLGDRQEERAPLVLESMGKPMAEPMAEPTVEPTAEPMAEAPPEPYRPLWHYLDEFRESTETALVEMAPSRGRTPRVVSWRLLSRRVRQLAAG